MVLTARFLLQPHETRIRHHSRMQNLKTLADQLLHARRASEATGDPLLRVAAYDARRRFKYGKRNNPQHALQPRPIFAPRSEVLKVATDDA